MGQELPGSPRRGKGMLGGEPPLRSPAPASSPPSRSTARSAQDGEMMPELTEPLSSRQAENKGINTGGQMGLQPLPGQRSARSAQTCERGSREAPSARPGVALPPLLPTQTAAQVMGVLMAMRNPPPPTFAAGKGSTLWGKKQK